MQPDLNILAAGDGSSPLPRLIGSGLIILIFLAGIVHCIAIARREKTNTRSALGLLMILVAVLVLTVAAIWLIGSTGLGAAVALVLVVILVLGLIAAGASFAGLGMAEIRRQPGRFDQGLQQSIWSFVLGGVALVVLLIGTAAGLISAQRDVGMLQTASGRVAGQTVPFPEYNFKFTMPAEPWGVQDVSTVNKLIPEAVVALGRNNPAVFFGISSAVFGPDAPTAENVNEFRKAQLQQISGSFEFLEQTNWAVSGIPGIRMYCRVSTTQFKLTMVNWVASIHGRVYLMSAYGRVEDEAVVRQEAEKLMQGFSELDTRNIAQAPVLRPGDTATLASQRNKYTLHALPGWEVWPNVQSVLPFAEYGLHNGNDTYLYTAAIRLKDHTVDFEVVVTAVAQTLHAGAIGARATRENRSGIETARLLFETQDKDSPQIFHEQAIVRINRMIFVVHGWTSNPNKRGMINQAINSVDLSPDVGTEVEFNVSLGERAMTGMVENNLAILLMNQMNDPARAANSFADSVEHRPEEPQSYDNLCVAYVRSNQLEKAKQVLQLAKTRFPTDPRFQVREALMEAEYGDPANAEKLLAAIFTPGVRNDVVFDQYMQLLVKQGKSDEAIKMLEEYRKAGDTLQLAMRESVIYSGRGDHDKAIAVLTGLDKPDQFNPLLHLAIAQAYITANRPDDAIKSTELLISKGITAPDVYVLQANAHMSKKQYTQAKQAAESALKIDRNHPRSQEAMRQAQIALGEPTSMPSTAPSTAPGSPQTLFPSAAPSTAPGNPQTLFPSVAPSTAPSGVRTAAPSTAPGTQPLR